jgi:recombination protein RecT
MPKTKQIVKKEQSMAEVFMTKVITEFTGGDHSIALTQFQRRLAKNYFIILDAVLAKAEAGRLKKTEKWRDKTPITWDHVNMQKLAQDVVAVCRIGLDPAQKNHINMIPYKNNTTKLYDIGFIEGYRGIELKSVKYGLDVPDAVIVKLVYSNDKFQPLMKDWERDVEAYEFRVVDAFDRGHVIGGFYYHDYNDTPKKNKLVVMTLEDIEKRKPKYASSEFWGGEKPIWENGKKTGKTETIDGWHKEMQWKTVCRAAYNDITIDSQKIDTDYMRLKEIEGSVAEYEVQKEIDRDANKEFIDIESGEVADAEFTDEDQQKNAQETPRVPTEKTEPEKDTHQPPAEDKETPEPQESADSEEKKGQEPEPFDEELSDKEKEDADIQEKKAFLEEAAKGGYLEEAAKNMKKYVAKLPIRTQEAIRDIYRELKAKEKKAAAGETTSMPKKEF